MAAAKMGISSCASDRVCAGFREALSRRHLYHGLSHLPPPRGGGGGVPGGWSNYFSWVALRVLPWGKRRTRSPCPAALCTQVLLLVPRAAGGGGFPGCVI